jgi:hypothetical protein
MVSDETKRAISKALTGRVVPEERKKRMRDAWLKRKMNVAYIHPRIGKCHSKINKQKRSERWLGELNPNYGKHLSEDVKQKIGDANRGNNWKGGMKSTVSRRRMLGFIPLNQEFEGSVSHHIDSLHIVFIPEKLHRSTWHSLNDSESMERINTLVYCWLLCNRDYNV